MQILNARVVWPLLLFFCYTTLADTRFYNFQIDYANYTVGCHSKQMVVVNGQSPGPVIRITRGDRVIINVTNLVTNNITIHWHGVYQKQSVWSDGAAYITQCPIQTGGSFIYNFTVPDQQGTLFWHAHIGWLRGTVYGAFVIDPKPLAKLPYPKPHGDHVFVLGEWWNDDVEEVDKNANIIGVAPALSNAYLINGHPGPLYNCSANGDTEIVNVEKGKRYLLRFINAALETDLFVTIANHNLTVVEADASYTKHITNTSFLISSGQTYNFLITANQPIGQYDIVVSPYQRNIQGVQETPALAILRYKGANMAKSPVYPSKVPSKNDSALFTQSQEQIRSLNSRRYPAKVPKTVDVSLYQVVSLNVEPCTVTPTNLCQGPNYTTAGNKTILTSFASSINNVTFQAPQTAVLQAYYYNTTGVYTTNFPAKPLTSYDYTGQQLAISSLATEKATMVTEIPFGANVELVMQGTVNFQAQGHPFHLHGTDFYVVGYGAGNYNSSSDPAKFNLIDPARRNTAMLKSSGWTALRWRAGNPGVWILHCHFEGHVSWGMATVFIVKNGAKPGQIVPAPPPDLPTC